MLILDIQFHNSDKAQAMALARLLADLQPVYRPDVTVLFAARFDTLHDDETVAYVAKKFPVRKFTTTVKSKGWPKGCNQLMAESYGHCIELVRNKLVSAKAVMLIEADCIPLHGDWLQMLIDEYNSCGKMVLGPWLKQGDAPGEHVNGNCIISIDFWKKNRVILTPPAYGGWDATCARAILPNAHPSKLMWSDYHLGTERNPWKGCNYLWEPKKYGSPHNAYYGKELFPVWYHGPKDLRGIECVRNRLLRDSVWDKRNELGGLLNKMGLTGYGAEVGVFKGEFAETILDSWNGKGMMLVDPWVNTPDYIDGTNDYDLSLALEETKEKVERFKSEFEIEIVRKASVDAALSIDDSSLDFVYLDARHDYASIKADIAAWWPKIKSGGVLAGHDYLHESIPGIFDCGVTQAVDEFARSLGLKIHVTDEDVKSWLIIKN